MATEAATRERALFIPLKAEHFDAFASGQKRTEYRKPGGQWNAKTCRVGRRVVLSRGYGKAHRMTGTICGFRCSETAALRPEFVAIYGDQAFAVCIDIELDQEPGRGE